MANLLVLGPDRRRAENLRSLLRQDGHDVTWRSEVDGWGRVEAEIRPEVIVAAADAAQPILAEPTPRRGDEFLSPILFVQGRSAADGDPYLADRLVDRMDSPYIAEEFLARVDALARVCTSMRQGSGLGGSKRGEGRGTTPIRRWGRQAAALLQPRRGLGRPTGRLRAGSRRACDVFLRDDRRGTRSRPRRHGGTAASRDAP